jgi:hypothetical protein
MHATGAPLVLKARTVTDLLDAAVGLYRHNFGTLLGVVALVHGPLLALGVVASGWWGWSSLATRPGGTPGPGQAAALAAGLSATSLVWLATLVFQPLASGAMVLAVSDLYLGRKITVRGAYRQALPSWGPLIGAQFLISLIVGAVGFGPGMVLMFVGGMLAALARSVVAGVVVMVLGVLVMLYLVVASYLCLMATIPAIMVERRTMSEALTRSFRLVSRGWKHALGAWVLLGLLVAVPLVVPYGLVVAAQVRGGLAGAPFATALTSGLASLVALLVMPVTLAGQVVIYYDLRVRQEGFDLEMMAANLGLKAAGSDGLPPPVALRGKRPPPPPPPIPHPLPPPLAGEGVAEESGTGEAAAPPPPIPHPLPPPGAQTPLAGEGVSEGERETSPLPSEITTKEEPNS